VKQAAFIRNPDYDYGDSYLAKFLQFVGCCFTKDNQKSRCGMVYNSNNPYFGSGAGPDIVTVGHNPYEPFLGDARHIVLQNTQGTISFSLLFFLFFLLFFLFMCLFFSCHNSFIRQVPQKIR